MKIHQSLILIFSKHFLKVQFHNMNIIPPPGVKPLFIHRIQIQNGFKYRDFHRRRYKETVKYKFTYPKEQDVKKTQKHLFRILKLTKFANTINFFDLKLREEWINQRLQLSIFKKISKTENISFKTSRSYQELSDKFVEKGLKYLSRIRRLFYVFEIGWSRRETQNPILKGIKNPLRTLRYCPKIQSVTIKIPPLPYALPPPNCFRDFSQYPHQLKHLVIQEKFPLAKPITSLNSLKNLKSIHVPFGKYHPDNIVNALDGLSNLTCLEEMSLNFEGFLTPEIYTSFAKITDRGILKKLFLQLDFPLSEFTDLLSPLDECQLTHFSLNSQVSQNVSLQGIAKFLQGKHQLESLKLTP